MKTSEWYSHLAKPSFAPPSWIFAPVWAFLYTLIAFSFGNVFLLAWQKEIPLLTALPFFLNLVFNFAFSPIQFTWHNNLLAAVDILFVLATILWMMFSIFPYAPWVAYLQIPYLIWVSFATVLQLTITYLNKQRTPTAH